MLISASRLRNTEVLVSFFRMSPSLCCTSGWRITTTSPVVDGPVRSASVGTAGD